MTSVATNTKNDLNLFNYDWNVKYGPTGYANGIDSVNHYYIIDGCGSNYFRNDGSLQTNYRMRNRDANSDKTSTRTTTKMT